MSAVKHAVISAAGLGSRLELNRPKCLVEIGDRRIIDYQLDLLKDVEDVRIVVGFMEEAVMEHVCKVRRDVVFVRNPDFRTTSNSYSVHLASRDLKHPFISLDGDLLIRQESFDRFIAACDGTSSVVGVTPSKTEEAVFALLDDSLQNVVGFSTDGPHPYEWSGLAYLKDINIEKNGGFIFRELERYLPLKACDIECYEVDTPEDLSAAIAAFAA